MANMHQDGSLLSVPLIVNESQEIKQAGKQQDTESNYTHPNEGTSSSFHTIFHGMNALSGIGILSAPYALASGGWLSMIFLFVLAIITFYSGLLIQRCMDVDFNIKSYPDIGERAFGNGGRMLVACAIYGELFVIVTSYLVLESDNLHKLIPNMVGVEVAGLSIDGKQIFVLIVALVVLPTVWLDNLNILSYVSATGVLASFIILIATFWVGAFNGVGFHEEGTLLRWDGIPSAISLYMVCFCGHPVFPTLYTSIKHKRQFPNVLFICFVLCTSTFALMAILGYLMFGSKVQSQITLNLPSAKFSSKIAIYTTLISPISKYALMLTPIVNGIKNWLPKNCNKKPSGYIISTALVISSVIVALVIPFFGYLMSLLGALFSVSTSIIFPCLCYLKISKTYLRFGREAAILIMIIVFGVVVAALGTYVSVVDIITHL